MHTLYHAHSKSDNFPSLYQAYTIYLNSVIYGEHSVAHVSRIYMKKVLKKNTI